MDVQTPDFARLMMEHAPVGMALYDLPDFRLLSANMAFQKQIDSYLLPRHIEAIVKQPLISWLPPEWIEEILTIFQNVAVSGIPFHDAAYELRIPDSTTGTTCWNWSLQPLADETGNTRYLLQTISEMEEMGTTTPDMADRARELYSASLTFDFQQSMVRSILDQCAEGILIVEIARGAMSYANEAAARFLGFSLPDLLLLPFHQHIWPHTQHHEFSGYLTGEDSLLVPWLFPVVHALCGETVKDQKALISQPDGKTRVVVTSSLPLRTEQGIITGAVVIFQDLTAQATFSQYTYEFLSMASHELRTPVTVIQGLAELLQLSISRGRAASSAYVQRIIRRLTEQSHHLAHLIEELLDVAMLEQGQFTLHRTQSDLLPLVVSSIEYFTETLTSSSQAIHLTLDGPIAIDTLIGDFDKERIMLAIRHLINYACTYSLRNSQIEVTLHYAPEFPHEVMLSIQNEGTSIAPHDLAHLFQPFHRTDTVDFSLSRLGLGLFLVHEIVTRHGGSIEVKQVEEHGIRFRVVLPLVNSL